MTTYHFEFEITHSGLRPRRHSRNRPLHEKRIQGIVYGDPESPGAYFYDLRARHPVAARMKRIIDITGATILITLLAPLFLLLFALVKLSSPGPAIFRQRRIGFRANPFHMYKFRTMVTGAHLREKELAQQSGGSFLKPKNDPRITPLGAFLRRYSLDELPQLFNVLEGTMSLVGPRPLLQSDLDGLTRRSTMRRFSMPPGITGLWQVSGRSSCSEKKRLQYDRQYVDRWSLALDFQILLRTVEVVITGKDSV